MPSSKKSKSKGHANDVERKVFYMSPESYIGEGGSGKPEGGTGKVRSSEPEQEQGAGGPERQAEVRGERSLLGVC